MRRHKTTLILLVAAILICSAAPAQSDTMIVSYDDALLIALEKNRDIHTAKEYIKWVEGKYVEERSAALPSVTISAYSARSKNLSTMSMSTSTDIMEDYSATVSISQSLFTWGKATAAIRSADMGMRLADENLRLARHAAVQLTTHAYLDAMLAKASLGIVEEDLNRKKARAEEARLRRDAGVATDYDVLGAEVSVSDAQSEVIKGRNNVRKSLDWLAYVLGVQGPIDVQGELATDIKPMPTLDEAYAASLVLRPEIREVQLNKKIARELITIAKADGRPQLSAQGSYGRERIDFDESSSYVNNWSFGLYLTYSVFDGLKTSGKVAQAQSDLRSIEIEESGLTDSVRMEIVNALGAISESEALIQASEVSVEQAERFLALSKRGYDLGVKVRLDIEDAELKLMQAYLSRANAWRDYRAAHIDLLLATGSIDQ